MVKVAILAILALSACSTTSGTFCSIAKPLRLSEQAIAAMSDEEVRDALAHNRKLQSLCGVKP